MGDNQILIGILGATIVILILIVVVILVIVFARRGAIRQELKDTQFQNKLNELSLSSLRAQMNPHFIFNCLNSIKFFTEHNEKEKASEYLSKFSKLIRNILEFSREESTILSSELETLELYLSLESLRFNNKLTYEIIVDKNVDVDFIEIPPLIIQPYVENAIWHGLMHKESGGKIGVNIKQENEQNFLVITIEDDGIGREKSQLIQKEKNAHHKSFGTKISQERLDLLNINNEKKASITILDLKGDDDTISGTRVLIKIPTL